MVIEICIKCPSYAGVLLELKPVICTPDTEMDQEATDPEFVEISDLDDEEGSGSGPRCLKC